MEVCINGDLHHVSDSVGTIDDLLKVLGLKSEGRIVEVNGELFKESAFHVAKVSDGAVIEIIQFMGGGDFLL